MSHQSQLRFFTTPALQDAYAQGKAALDEIAAHPSYKPTPGDAVARTLLGDLAAELTSRSVADLLPKPSSFFAIRSKLSHIRSMVEELQSDARQAWEDSDGELDEPDDSLVNDLEDLANAIAELEPEEAA